MPKKLLGVTSVFILAAGLLVSLNLAGKKQDIRQKAAGSGSVLFIEPANINVNPGETFQMLVNIDTKDDTISAAELHLTYDPTVISGVSITPGDFLPTQIVTGRNTNGNADIILGAKMEYDIAGNATPVPRKGIGTLLTLKFTALKTSITQIIFSASTQIVANGKAGNTLAQSAGAAVTVLDIPPTPTVTPNPGATDPTWGLIANDNYKYSKITSALFYAGPPNPNSLQLYTRHPLNQSRLDWSDNSDIQFALDQVKNAQINVLKIPYFGYQGETDNWSPSLLFSKYDWIDRNRILSEDDIVNHAKDFFQLAQNNNILFSPLIEVSPANPFYEQFPYQLDNMTNRIVWLLQNFSGQENWLKVIDKNGQPRLAVWLIETIHLGDIDPYIFATGFDELAKRVETATGLKIGFIIDPTPLSPYGSDKGPDPLALKTVNSILAVNPFNITSQGLSGGPERQISEDDRLAYAESIVRKWSNSSLPFITPFIPGYDAHLVFPDLGIYGFNDNWFSKQKYRLFIYPRVGVSFDTWNGYTEGYAIVPTTEDGERIYNWVKGITAGLNIPPNQVYFENQYLRVWDSRVLNGIIDLFYKNENEEWEQYNNLVPIAKVNGVWNNAELENSVITREIMEDSPVVKRVKYQFSKFYNGAHFYLLMEMENDKPYIKFTVIPNEDSSQIQAFSIGNYFGLANLVRYIRINNQIFDAFSYPRPSGENYQPGDFYTLPAPENNQIVFWGNGKIEQKQFVDQPLTDQDVVMAEIRYMPWLPVQSPPGQNWFETLHITREPFNSQKSTFYFGITPMQIPGDLNRDWTVNIDDYNILISDFGKTGIPGFIPADIIKDGKVDLQDYNKLITNFGRKINNPTPTPSVTPVIISGLMSNYKMDETSGTTVSDNAGSNNGIAAGTAIVDGKSGKARSFNGQNDQVNVPSNFGIGTTNATVAMWVNVPSVTDKGAFIKIGKDGGFGIGVGNSNFDSNGNKLIMLYEYVRWIPTNKSIGTGWHHIAMVIDSAGIPTAYLDGQSAGTYPGGNAHTPEAVTGIGGYQSGAGARNFTGIIDEVQIYNRALLASEVGSIYGNTISPTNIPTATPVTTTVSPVPTCDSNSWGSWRACSASCGGGTQTRTNACGGTQTQSCNTQPCPTAPPWRCFSDSDCQQGWTCDNGSCYREINEPRD